MITLLLTNMSIQGGSKDSSDYAVDVELPAPVPADRVEVTFDRKRFDAKPLSPSQSDLVFATWRKRLELNPSLYDGLKFRYVSSSEGEGGVYNLNLGLTSYARYLGTNRNADEAFVESLMAEGIQKHGSRSAYLSDTFGNGAIVITKDRCIPLIRRSMKTGEFAGYWDVPGGHAEPHRVGITSFDDINNVDNSMIKDELFSSIIDEVHSELNVPLDKIQPPQFFGILRSNASRGRPGMMFIIHIDMTADELAQRLVGEGEEAYESTMFALIPIAVVVEGSGKLYRAVRGLGVGDEKTDLPESLDELKSTLCPSAGFCMSYLSRTWRNNS